jgi:hypothetical protein
MLNILVPPFSTFLDELKGSELNLFFHDALPPDELGF